MKTPILLFFACVAMMLTSCKNPSKQVQKPENPFFAGFDTPFGVPAFDQIDTTDYLPAFQEGIKQQSAEIQAIVDNPAEADFANTILAFDKSGKMLNRVSKVFFNLSEANTNDQIQALANVVSPLLSKHGDDIAMNSKLFERIKKVYDKRKTSNLDAQQIRVVEKYFRDFERQGANLPKDKQDELRKINEQLGLLSIKFGDNVLAETNKNFKLTLDKKEDLVGLPDEVVTAAAEAAEAAGQKGKWVFTLAKPSWIPFLQNSPKRELREKIYRAYFMRGDNNNANDNKKVLADIVMLRAQKAKLLGYKSFADYVIDDNMAKTPANVDAFLNKLIGAAMPVAKQELAEMQAIADKEGAGFKLQSWDWWYYAEKLHKLKYDLNESEIKPYLSYDNVLQGLFSLANKLYGITFTELTNLPKYQKDVKTYEVKEADGKHLGIVYVDPYTRDVKKGGAWCTDFLSAGWENNQRVDPVISVVFNFPPPTGDTPSLLSWDDATTVFHEFGHALHGLFTQGKYSRTAGNVPTDYVELPSQVMENWAGQPEVLKMYAKHYKTGNVIPDSLIAKIQKSGLFNQGFETVEYLAAAILDMDYHELAAPAQVANVDGFEKSAMAKINLINEIIPRYRSTYFSHIFDGGYGAGYYVYIWAAVLDADAFDYFKQSGDIFNKGLAAKFRKFCLAESGDDEGMVQYKKFRGQDPSLDPLLKRRGLK